MSIQLISIVLPVYNQAVHIGPIIGEYISALTELKTPFEILPVINGPRRDQSLQICQRTSAEDPRVRTLCTDQGGWGHAVRVGLREAKGDLLCYTNSARTLPGDLRMFLRYGLAHPEFVIKANRKIRDGWRRRLGSLLYNLECRALFDLPYWDINGTPKVFPRSLEPLVNLEQDGDLIDLEFNAICRRENYTMLEVPIFSTNRHGGDSTTNYGSAWRMYSGAYKLWKRMNGR